MGKGIGFFKIRAMPQLSQLVNGVQKLDYSKHSHVCDMVAKVRSLSKIKRKAEVKGPFVFRRDAQVIHAIE